VVKPEKYKLKIFIFLFQAINFASKLFLAPSPSRLTRITLNLVENKRKWGLKKRKTQQRFVVSFAELV
jgi:hypothetical protein